MTTKKTRKKKRNVGILHDELGLSVMDYRIIFEGVEDRVLARRVKSLVEIAVEKRIGRDLMNRTNWRHTGSMMFNPPTQDFPYYAPKQASGWNTDFITDWDNLRAILLGVAKLQRMYERGGEDGTV